MSDDSEFLQHEPCPSCGSSDAGSRYTDGHFYCFSCRHYEGGDGEEHQPTRRKRVADLLPTGEYIALTKRKLTEETCRRGGYSVGKMGGKPVQIAAIIDPTTGEEVAQKVRTPDKDFVWRGEKSDALYLMHLCKDGGRKIVITEGEIDALSVLQIQEFKWPVVSITKGAKGAAKQLKANLATLEKFDEVVLMFDNDEAGREAVAECAPIFRPGKCKIATLPLKDANDMLVADKGEDVIRAIWQAKSYRPDGIVTIKDIKEKALRPIELGLPWFLPAMTKLTHGRRYGEIYTFGAGTGVGKTDFLTEQIAFDISELKEKVALFFLEQEPEESAKRLAGKIKSRRFHVPDAGWKQEELVAALDVLEADDRVSFYDHFGCAEWTLIENHIRFLAHSEGVRIFYVDHLTALADPANERESLETLMGAVGGLVKELKIIVHLVSHLSTPEGKPHEEGGRVMIRHFKGSRAIGFWSHFMFGLERNQQSDDDAERKTTTFRVLKDRYTGQSTGEVFYLGYDVEHGRLHETEPPSDHAFAGKEEHQDF